MFLWRFQWQCLWKHDVLPAVVFFFFCFSVCFFFFLSCRFKGMQGTVRSGLITVLTTVRSNRGSHGSLLLSSRTVLDSKRTAKMSGSRFFRSDRTVRSGFHNHANRETHKRWSSLHAPPTWLSNCNVQIKIWRKISMPKNVRRKKKKCSYIFHTSPYEFVRLQIANWKLKIEEH